MRVGFTCSSFDLLHAGHVAMLQECKNNCDYLVVGLNSDAWLTRKKGRPFMPIQERVAIVKELECVDEVIAFDNSDNTACAAIMQVLSTKATSWEVVFANGGDRTNTTTPEYQTYGDRKDVHFAFGVGGEDKKNSSSWILKEWSQPTTERAWGKYTVLDKGDGWQVKQLEFYEEHALSDQRHFKRSEHWHVVDGVINMFLEDKSGNKTSHLLVPGDSIDIPVGYWHKAVNLDNKSAKVIEVWMGQELTEDDIERRD